MVNHKVKEVPKNYIGIIALLYIFKNLPNVVPKQLSFHRIFFVFVGTNRL
ncbi:hypothetical protein BACERE00177_02793 [Bacillus mobilis]|nr:hypothetical protein BACERE00177_02793 [Bacillus mobilis]